MEIKILDKNEIQILLDILMERAKWLESINQPMWSTENLCPVNFEKVYPDETPYLVYQDQKIVGGFILLKKDFGLWTQEENNQNAYYIHKLVIKPEFSGKGYASETLKLIKNMAEENGISYLRLDCYGDRPYLRRLYESCGFKQKRQTVVDDGTLIISYEMCLV